MQLYDAKVRIDGNRDHEVVKHNLTAAEIHLLQHIHLSPQGHPVVVDIKHVADVNRSDAKERARLANEYTKGELSEDRGAKLINSLFGVAGVALPQTYIAPEPIIIEDFAVEDESDEEVVPVAPIVRSELKKPKKADDLVG